MGALSDQFTNSMRMSAPPSTDLSPVTAAPSTTSLQPRPLALALRQYANDFKKNGFVTVNGDLVEEDLDCLQATALRHRNDILAAIAQLRRSWAPAAIDTVRLSRASAPTGHAQSSPGRRQGRITCPR